MENMTDLQILDLIRNDLIKVQNGLDTFQNDMKKVHDGMKILQESLATALECTKEYGSVEEDGLCDVEACVGDSICDDPQQQIFIAAEDDDLVDEVDDAINLGDELSSSVDNQVVVPYLDETMDDIDIAANGHARETPKSGLKEFEHVDGDDYNAENDLEIVTSLQDQVSQVYGASQVGDSREFKQWLDDARLVAQVHMEQKKVSDGFVEVRVWSYFPVFDPGIYIWEDECPNASTFRGHTMIDDRLMVAHGTIYVLDSFELSHLHPLLATTSPRLREFDPFWIATLKSAIEARERLMLMNLVCTCNNELFLHSMTPQHLKIVLKGEHVFLGSAMVRDYDGFNGPGFFRGAFDSILALVRDYDGFNGPGHTLRTRCL